MSIYPLASWMGSSTTVGVEGVVRICSRMGSRVSLALDFALILLVFGRELLGGESSEMVLLISKELLVEGALVDFNLVQYFTANRFSIKKQKIYSGKYTHYTYIFPLEIQMGKTNIFYIHS
jgi:hypothetical protein